MEILHLTLIGFIALVSLFDSTPCTQRPFRTFQRYLLDWAELHTPDVFKQSAQDALQERDGTGLGSGSTRSSLCPDCGTITLHSVEPNTVSRQGEQSYGTANPSSIKWASFFTNVVSKTSHANQVEYTAAAGNATEMPSRTERTRPDGDTTQIDNTEATLAFMVAGLVLFTVVSTWRKSFGRRTLRWTLSSPQLEIEEPYVIPTTVVLAPDQYSQSTEFLGISIVDDSLQMSESEEGVDFEEFSSCLGSPQLYTSITVDPDIRSLVLPSQTVEEAPAEMDEQVSGSLAVEAPREGLRRRTVSFSAIESDASLSDVLHTSVSYRVLSAHPGCPHWPPRAPSPSELPPLRPRSRSLSQVGSVLDIQEFQSNAGYAPLRPQAAVVDRRPIHAVNLSRAEASSNWRSRRRPRVAAEGWDMVTEHLARAELENRGAGLLRARQPIRPRLYARRIPLSEALGEEDTIIWDPRH